MCTDSTHVAADFVPLLGDTHKNSKMFDINNMIVSGIMVIHCTMHSNKAVGNNDLIFLKSLSYKWINRVMPDEYAQCDTVIKRTSRMTLIAIQSLSTTLSRLLLLGSTPFPFHWYAIQSSKTMLS